MAKISLWQNVLAVSLTVPLRELISTSQALEFRDLKLPSQMQKRCHRYRLTTNFSSVVFILQQTQCSSQRDYKGVSKKPKMFPGKAFLYAKNKLRSYSGGLRLPLSSPPKCCFCNLHYVSVHVCLSAYCFLGKRGTASRRTIQRQKRTS